MSVFDTVYDILSISVVVLMCAAATTLLVYAPAYAASVPLDYSYDDYDTSVGVPTLLEYEGTQMTITTAALGTFPFLELSVSFEDGAVTADTQLELLLSDVVFDPLFDADADFQILTETDFHEKFEISNRNLIISELTVGIETVEIFVVQETTSVEDVDDNVADDTMTDPTAPEDIADDTMTDPTAPEDIADDILVEDVFGPDDIPFDLIEIPGADTVDNFEDLTMPDISDVQPFDTSKCGPGTVLVDGACILETDVSDDTKCGPGTVLVDGACVLDSSDSSSVVNDDESESIPVSSNTKINGRDLVAGVVAGFVVAGFVGVILALIHRAGRKKSLPKTPS